ncbi:hypothetical protein DRN97_01815 [Methanosarcinales archaeon]|nr:MAG: hypothetical protein DRN97_01815 [Methanosarcinales archaeon]
MDKKFVVAVIAAVVVIGVIAGCVEKPAPEVTPTPEITPTPKITPAPAPAITPAPSPAVAATVSCDMCHQKEHTANLKAHVKGGLLVNGRPGCFDYWGCHGVANATVHTVHPPEVGCVACHGKIPTIPQKGPGGTTCEQCHGTPNPLEPSEGRLVEIHLNRGKDCTVCHVGEISEIHGLK